MATLLDGVNELLKRVQQIDNDVGLLTTLTDSARQSQIDVSVQIWNELVDYLYNSLGQEAPNNMTEDSSSITLVAGQREYSLPSDLVMILWPLIDTTNGREIVEFPGGYHEMIESQLIPDNYEGTPLSAAIKPTNGALYLDSDPTAEDAGKIYTLYYLKDLELTSASDTLPFNNVVFRSLVPAAAELYKWEKHRQFSRTVFKSSIGRAARLMSRQQRRKSWGRKFSRGRSLTDPMER